MEINRKLHRKVLDKFTNSIAFPDIKQLCVCKGISLNFNYNSNIIVFINDLHSFKKKGGDPTIQE